MCLCERETETEHARVNNQEGTQVGVGVTHIYNKTILNDKPAHAVISVHQDPVHMTSSPLKDLTSQHCYHREHFDT